MEIFKGIGRRFRDLLGQEEDELMKAINSSPNPTEARKLIIEHQRNRFCNLLCALTKQDIGSLLPDSVIAEIVCDCVGSTPGNYRLNGDLSSRGGTVRYSVYDFAMNHEYSLLGMEGPTPDCISPTGDIAAYEEHVQRNLRAYTRDEWEQLEAVLDNWKRLIVDSYFAGSNNARTLVSVGAFVAGQYLAQLAEVDINRARRIDVNLNTWRTSIACLGDPMTFVSTGPHNRRLFISANPKITDPRELYKNLGKPQNKVKEYRVIELAELGRDDEILFIGGDMSCIPVALRAHHDRSMYHIVPADPIEHLILQSFFSVGPVDQEFVQFLANNEALDHVVPNVMIVYGLESSRSLNPQEIVRFGAKRLERSRLHSGRLVILERNGSEAYLKQLEELLEAFAFTIRHRSAIFHEGAYQYLIVADVSEQQHNTRRDDDLLPPIYGVGIQYHYPSKPVVGHGQPAGDSTMGAQRRSTRQPAPIPRRDEIPPRRG